MDREERHAIKVMLVDDEHFFIRDARQTIEAVRDDCRIVYEAYDAMDAINNIRLHNPDIIFVDIKMPGMDGISLIKEVKKMYPDMILIILSGYQDFELARDALRAGADDYLLKPLEKDILKNVLNSKIRELHMLRRRHEYHMLSQLIRKYQIDIDTVRERFNYPVFILVVITGDNVKLKEQEVEGITGILTEDKENCWVLDQKFDMGQVILFGLSYRNIARVKELVQNIFLHVRLKENTCSIVVSPFFAEITELGSEIEKMENEINSLLVLGHDRICFADDKNVADEKISLQKLLSEFENRLYTAIWTRNWSAFSSNMKNVAEYCGKGMYSKATVIKFLNKIADMLEKNCPTCSKNKGFNIENNIRKIVRNARSYKELIEMYLELISDVFIFDTTGYGKNDKDLMEMIESYLKDNISNKVNVEDICNLFCISQSKMSRIFKTYKGMSFVEYFTFLKMEVARKILEEQPDAHISSIAQMLGFNDVFYFSKVFKKITSYTPTQYKSQ